MQLILAFLNLTTPAPTPSPPSQQLRDPKTRAEAVDILARLIAQAGQPATQVEATDE